MTENIDGIPQANQILYMVKLRTGEELLCTLVDDTDDGLTIECPIVIKYIPWSDGDGNIYNKLLTSRWCPFSGTDLFWLSMSDIMVYGPMAEDAHLLYIRLVNKHNGSANPEPDDERIVQPHQFVFGSGTLQ